MFEVGRQVPRKEGLSKVTGLAKYVDDLAFEGLLYGVTVRSPVARGILKKIKFTGDIPWSEVTVVVASDIPGRNFVQLLEQDQPFLVEQKIQHAEEPICLIAHENFELVQSARNYVQFEIEEQEPVLTLDESLNQKAIIWRKDNVFKSFNVKKGDVENAMKNSPLVIDESYETGAQEQLYIEPQGFVARVDLREGVMVWGSLQCPHYVQKALMPLFNFPPEKVRVIQTETGGGFGGKEEYPSILAGHAALLSWKSGRPVKMIYDRAEDMAATTKRHPSRTRIKAGVSKDGKLLALDIDFTIDGGAYCTLSPVVLSRGTIHAAGPYHCEHVRIQSRAVATNTPPQGAFRGFGAPQSIFAMERHMDRVGQKLGIDPIEIRKRNFLKKGQTTATSQVIREDLELGKILDKAVKISHYHKKRAKFQSSNLHSKVKKGMGISCFMHGAGFTGSGERYLQSVAGVEVTEDGKIRVLASSTEIGQGTNTLFSQIAADTLQIDYEDIEVAQPDTHAVPNSGPTVASRTCMIVGDLVKSACEKLRGKLVEEGFLVTSYDRGTFMHALKKWLKVKGRLQVFSQYQKPSEIDWDDEKTIGDAYAAYAWAAYIAEVSVDTITFETKVESFTAVQEVGRVIHPVLAEGQIEGGVVQGIGYALYEKVVWDKGRMANHQMTNYIIPTALDVPRIGVHFEELHREHGPFGAKGIGELPLDGPAPAILNAVQDATGISVHEIPMLPEDLLSAYENTRS